MEFFIICLPAIIVVAGVLVVRFKWSIGKIAAIGSVLCTAGAVVGKYQEIISWEASADPVEQILWKYVDIPAELIGTAITSFILYLALWAIAALVIRAAYRRLRPQSED